MATLAGKVFAILAVGWLAHDAWEYHNTFVLWDLKVVAQENQYTYDLQRASEPIGQVFPFEFCGDYVPDMKVGDHIEVIAGTNRTFPVRCHSVAAGPLGIVYR